MFRFRLAHQLTTYYVSSVLYKSFLADVLVSNNGFKITLLQRIKLFSGVRFYNWVNGSWCMERVKCLHLQGSYSPGTFSWDAWALNTKTQQSFEMLATIYPTTQCHTPENLNTQQHSCEILKSCKSTENANPLLHTPVYISFLSFQAPW